MKDIAVAAGVSQSTVSRILNRTPLVVPISKETRERVLAAAVELAYRPNPHARGLRGAPTMLVGAIVRDVTDPFFAPAIEALSAEARQRGYSVVLGHAGQRADEALALATVLEARQCDAIVIAGDMRNQPQLLADLEVVHVPVVAVWDGAQHGGFSSVNVDNRHGIELALNHLARLGHTRIAFAGNPMLGDIQERQAAYEDYVASKGLASYRKYIQHVPNSFEGGVAAFEALLQLRDPPTAVAAATDVLAIGMLHCAYEHGLDVPADFSIVGFDDIPFAAMTTPPLSTVRMPVKKMARAAVGMAIDRRTTPGAEGANEVRIFRPSFVVRSSSAKPVR
jgi:DNA-binding LacI/PurR family transcriptional regulator